MPSFEIPVDEYLSSCKSSDIKQIIKALIQDGHLKGYSHITGELDMDALYGELQPNDIQELIKIFKEEQYFDDIIVPNNTNVAEHFFEKDLMKLHGKWNCLSQEEEEIIKKIANRF